MSGAFSHFPAGTLNLLLLYTTQETEYMYYIIYFNLQCHPPEGVLSRILLVGERVREAEGGGGQDLLGVDLPLGLVDLPLGRA